MAAKSVKPRLGMETDRERTEGHGTPNQGTCPTIKRTAGEFLGVGNFAPLAESRPMSVNQKSGGNPPTHGQFK